MVGDFGNVTCANVSTELNTKAENNIVKLKQSRCGRKIAALLLLIVLACVSPKVNVLQCGLAFCFSLFRFMSAVSSVRVACNVLQLPEGGDFYYKCSCGEPMFDLPQMYLRSTEPPLLGRCCVRPEWRI